MWIVQVIIMVLGVMSAKDMPTEAQLQSIQTYHSKNEVM
jgi:hypothetical protein